MSSAYEKKRKRWINKYISDDNENVKDMDDNDNKEDRDDENDDNDKYKQYEVTLLCM